MAQKGLFRSSRPDYIETARHECATKAHPKDCSGLPDRTTLRRQGRQQASCGMSDCSGLPDRTTLRRERITIDAARASDCSGLPDRTTLRRGPGRNPIRTIGNCSGLPDRTTLRPGEYKWNYRAYPELFRSSRPDYIETCICFSFVALFTKLFRSSRPDYIETSIIVGTLCCAGWYCSGLPDRTTLRR